MLIRSIRKWDLVLLVINSIIGAGIFGLPSKVFVLSGSYSLAAFGVCAMVAAIFIFVFAEVSSRFDRTGGPYVYVLEAFGPFAAFLVGWLLILGRIFNYATLINLLIVYLSLFSPAFTEPAIRIISIVLATGTLCFINYIGVRDSTRFNNIVTVGKLIPLALFIIVGLFFLQADRYSFASAPPVSAFTGSVLLLIFAFGGFESALVTGGEMINPRKDLPFALLVAAITVVSFYCLIQLVCIGTLPSLATSDKPLADAATRMLGSIGGAIIAAGAAVSITGTLNTIMLSGTRMPFALSEQDQFPKIFARLHPRYRTPTWSIVGFGALVCGVSIGWSFMSALNVAVIIRLTLYSSVCAALIALRRKPGNVAHFTVKGGPVLAVAGIAISIYLMTSSKWKEILDFLIWIAAGLVLYVIMKGNFTRRRGDAAGSLNQEQTGQ